MVLGQIIERIVFRYVFFIVSFYLKLMHYIWLATYISPICTLYLMSLLPEIQAYLLTCGWTVIASTTHPVAYDVSSTLRQDARYGHRKARTAET